MEVGNFTHPKVIFGSFVLPGTQQDANQGMTCSPNGTVTRVYSYGWSSKNDPMRRSLNMLMIQLVAIIVLSKSLYIILRPLRQPRIVCDFIVGLILGSPGFGQGSLREVIHPLKYTLRNRTVRALGLSYYFFIMAVKTDPLMMVQSGRKACIIGVCTVVLPFIVITALSYSLRSVIITPIVHGSFSSFLGATLSITFFPVVGDILGELHLLNTEIGRLGLSSSMVHSAFAWFAMATFTGMNQKQNQGHMAYSMLAMISMAAFIVVVFGKATRWIVRRTPKGARVRDGYIIAIMVSVMGLTLVSDAIGASFMQGPIILGLVVPDGPPLGSALVEKLELIPTELLVPFFFFGLGNFIELPNFYDWILLCPLVIIIVLGFAAKMMAAILGACYCKIPLRKATMLGLIMNFRGIVEMVIFINLTNGQLLDNRSFAILALMSMALTAIAAPLVSFYYEPLASATKPRGRRTIQHLKDNTEALILACVHSDDPVPAMINLLEASNPDSGNTMCIYVLHLVELVGRTSSALIAHKNKKGYINPTRMDRRLNAFINFEQVKQGVVSVMPFTVLAPYKGMHQDICSMAIEKKAVFVLLPYPRKEGVGVATTPADGAMRSIVSEILNMAPCSLGILVHQGLGSPALPSSNFRYYVGLIFWGGHDDREALSYASRMARHPGVTLKVTRIIPAADMRDESERRLDDQVVEDFKIMCCNPDKVVFRDEVAKDMEQTLVVIKSNSMGHDLLIVGRNHGPNCYLSEDLAEWRASARSSGWSATYLPRRTLVVQR